MTHAQVAPDTRRTFLDMHYHLVDLLDAMHPSELRLDRHPLSLDDTLPGTEGMTLGSTLGTADGYSAWCGQPSDDIAALERRLDLARAGEAIDPGDHSLCTALTEHTPHAFAAQGVMPRMRIYRRLGEMRLCLLAAGLGAAG